MRKELDQELCRKFPNLFRDRFADMRTTCLCWGFECGDGWYQLIHDASEKLEKLILQIPEAERVSYTTTQVKEKYGSLSWYMSGTDEMWQITDAAEHRSQYICEECGKSGRIRGHSWYSCRCLKCARDEELSWAEQQIKKTGSELFERLYYSWLKFKWFVYRCFRRY